MNDPRLIAFTKIVQDRIKGALNYTWKLYDGFCYTCQERFGQQQYNTVIHHEQNGQYQCPCGSFEARIIGRKD